MTVPHVLTLSTWDEEDYLGEDFGYWDECTITCPYRPPVAHMPCAVWEPCKCTPPAIGELDHENEPGLGIGPCSNSPTGIHHQIEGEPNRPIAACWAQEWDESIQHCAFEIGLMAGTYLVRPWWDGDTIQLDLIDPLVATR